MKPERLRGNFEMKGLEKVMANLNSEVQSISERSVRGMIRAAIIARRDMEKTSPVIPVDTSNLRASFFTVTSTGKASGRGDFKGPNAEQMKVEHEAEKAALLTELSYEKKPTLVMGFSANYAVFVHENVGANFQRPGAGAKFFQAGLRRNIHKMVRVIAEEAKIR